MSSTGKKVAIIGGGVAGLLAAVTAADHGAKVLLFEKMDKVGLKMGITGKGRCNLTNNAPIMDFIAMTPGNGRFLFSAYKRFNNMDLLSLFHTWGLETKVERGGRIFPASDDAQEVRHLFMRLLHEKQVDVHLSEPVLHIQTKKGCAAGVVTGKGTYEADAVILATGGAGRLHYQGFPTSNHYGATADGLVLGYRAGAKLLYPDTLQYHPTGAAYPAQIYGALVTEKVRSVGAMLVNADGEVFMNPLETRDVAAASIIRECTERGKGVKTPAGQAVWLDTPMIELKNGAGTIEKRIPAMMRMFAKHGIDIRKEPILVYPTLHYQNGGLHITADGQTDVENLFAAGEVVGGIHGRNRLMGNSLLDVIVFGRNAGQHAAEKAKSVSVGTLTLDHVAAFEAEKQQAGVTDHRLSPQLLPDYARKIHPAEK